jgi:hypothetical protein
MKRALIASFMLHSVCFILLLFGRDWSHTKSKQSLKPIEARLVIKNQHKNKQLLPKKITIPSPKPDDINQENAPALKQAGQKELTKKPLKQEKDSSQHLKKLSSLSQMFAKELATEEVVEPEGEVADDSSYFDQVYTLIKESFVVPSHLDGPKGESLQAVLRIFLASDGSLNKLDLETPSGDPHFDKAVVDGTKRVNNFGAVPIFLQNVLRERGIVVELCPVKCKDAIGGR